MSQEQLFGPIIGVISEAMALLGADSSLLAAVGSWRDSRNDDDTLADIQKWIEQERDRIAGLIDTYRASGFWEPCRRYSQTDQGRSRLESPRTNVA